jgi:hypothetical protein
MAIVVSQEFLTFLKTVDSPQVVSDENLTKIAEAFSVCYAFYGHLHYLGARPCEANDISCSIEMIGVDYTECVLSMCPLHALRDNRALHVVPDGRGLSGGLKGFMRRAIEKANER